jgi:hypothetical protein
MVFQSWTSAEIRAAATERLFAGLALTTVMIEAVSPEIMGIGGALARENHR